MRSPFFHLHIKNISRQGTDGRVRSVLAKAAYNAGENMWLAREERHTTLARRYDIFLNQILAPAEAPAWACLREQLWNTVDAAAKRKDARLAKEITAAITVGIPPEQWRAMVTEFAAYYVALGQVVDIAIHEDGSFHNPHVHFLMTVNHLKPEGFGLKITEVDQKRFLTQARRRWEAITNQYLKANGLSIRVDARSYKARGLSQQPTRHRGANRAERLAWQQRAQQAHLQAQEQPMQPTNKDDPTNIHKIEPHRETSLDSMPSDDPRTWFELAQEQQRRTPVSVDRAALFGAQWDRSLDVVEQARAEPASEQEQALRAVIQDAPEPVRYEVETEILHQKMQRIAAKDQVERLTYLERNLDADSLREFQAFMEQERQHQNDYPLPERGPNDELRSPVELADARRRMTAEYERDDEPQR